MPLLGELDRTAARREQQDETVRHNREVEQTGRLAVQERADASAGRYEIGSRRLEITRDANRERLAAQEAKVSALQKSRDTHEKNTEAYRTANVAYKNARLEFDKDRSATRLAQIDRSLELKESADGRRLPDSDKIKIRTLQSAATEAMKAYTTALIILAPTPVRDAAKAEYVKAAKAVQDYANSLGLELDPAYPLEGGPPAADTVIEFERGSDGKLHQVSP